MARGMPGFEVMITFTKSVHTLSELAARVPLLRGHRMVKNREALLQSPAAVVGCKAESHSYSRGKLTPIHVLSLGLAAKLKI